MRVVLEVVAILDFPGRFLRQHALVGWPTFASVISALGSPVDSTGVQPPDPHALRHEGNLSAF